MAEKIRVQKLLAQRGVCSRRKAEEMIQAGRVQVNGRPVKLGDGAVPGKDIITVDGQRLPREGEGRVYLALHKPRGFVTTMADERGRRCVAQLVADAGCRVYPVGRLDKDSEGLLLLTNDGEFANLCAHPSGHVAKTYRVTLRPGVTEEQLNRLSTGIELDGKMTAPANVRVMEVARLKRIAMGPVRLGMLPQGKYRELTHEEVRGIIAEAKKGGKRK